MAATRYVTPFREGGSLPGLVEADDLGMYVLKFRGAGQGLKALTAEIVVGELARRLGVDSGHVIVGRTHRGGPGEGEAAWELPGGGSLHNTGSWVFASAFHRPGTPPSPYWPGTVTWIEESGPPRRVRLLLDRSRDELRATTRRLASAA